MFQKLCLFVGSPPYSTSQSLAEGMSAGQNVTCCLFSDGRFSCAVSILLSRSVVEDVSCYLSELKEKFHIPSLLSVLWSVVYLP